jgi:uncharacterized protein with HEPN domain
MNESRLTDYLQHMRQATADACSYIDGLSKADFLTDKRTQQAVVMNLIILGEAVTKIMDHDCAFADSHPEVPWRNMRGMRNRIAHGYFEIDLYKCYVKTKFKTVIPGLTRNPVAHHWIPAFAGMTMQNGFSALLIVWETVYSALPELQKQLANLNGTTESGKGVKS